MSFWKGCSSRIVVTFVLLSLFSCLVAFASWPPSHTDPSAEEWPCYGHDPGGTKYAPLEQINKQNVATLRVAWVHDTGDFSDGSTYPTRSSFEATPLVVDGVMYVS